MDIRIKNTTDAKSDALVILNGEDKFASLILTMETIKTSIEGNWSDCVAKESAIKKLNECINYYKTKIIPALKKLGTSIDAYAIATEQLASARVGGGTANGVVSPVSHVMNEDITPAQYADSQKYSFDGYSSSRSIDNATEMQPGEIDAYLYGKAIDAGMTDEQAKLCIAISRYETGDYTSNRFVNDCNWGGTRGGSSSLENFSTDDQYFVLYDDFNQGAEDFVLSVKRCFDKGCTNLADIQRSYCPDTDANGYSHWLSMTSAIYNDRFVTNTRIMERK